MKCAFCDGWFLNSAPTKTCETHIGLTRPLETLTVAEVVLLVVHHFIPSRGRWSLDVVGRLFLETWLVSVCCFDCSFVYLSSYLFLQLFTCFHWLLVCFCLLISFSILMICRYVHIYIYIYTYIHTHNSSIGERWSGWQFLNCGWSFFSNSLLFSIIFEEWGIAIRRVNNKIQKRRTDSQRLRTNHSKRMLLALATGGR